MSAIRRSQLVVGCLEALGVQHRLRAAAHQFGAIGAEFGGQLVELFDEVVVELHEYLTSGHHHMVSHMARAREPRLAERGEPAHRGIRRRPS